jgi:hypothetical protein
VNKYKLFPIVLMVLVLGILSISANNVFAQHEIDPETWIEMRKMFRKKGPTLTIEEDIAALAGPDAKRAGPRLIDRGTDALPAVHGALRSPEVDPRHAQRLLQVLRFIGNKSSVPVVIELLKDDRKKLLRRDALLVLAYIPPTNESAALVIGIAKDEKEPWFTRRMAYTWFGLHLDSRGRPFAESLRSDPDPEKRGAGLFVLARLGDKTVLEPVTRIFADGTPANLRDTLLLSLAEITTPEEFEQRAPASLAWSDGYKEALLYAQYSAAGPQEKIPLCQKMLRSGTPGHRELGVRCLLDSGHAKDLRPYAAVELEAPGRDALIRNDIRKAGWRIIDTDDEFSIVPAGPDKTLL